jgi:thiosulfate/3-mercaptopyruvate sulfurtransferase
MAFRTLISTDALAARLDHPSFAIVDCRFRLDDVSWGEREWTAQHVPGAVYAHLDRDLSGEKSGRTGRHPLPDADVLAATLGRLGIADGIQVIAYDQDTGMFASRLWWLLRWLGHDAVAVLDGGFRKWTAEGRATSAGVEQRAAREFVPQQRPEMAVAAAHVAAHASNGSWRLLDARAPERYRGESEPLDRVPGHIPGASNHFYQWNLADDGTFRTPEELRAQFAPRLGGVDPGHVVSYCGSGVTACHNLLALEHAGMPGAKLYPGSWSEWSSDPARPVETADLNSELRSEN